MRYVVTGGAGFIGSNLVDYLLARYTDAEIVVLDNLTYAGIRDNLREAEATGRVKFIKGDVCDEKAARRACKGADVVVHLAAESHVDRSILSGQEAAQTNFMGTFTMLEAARRANVGKFLHVSTDEVYGSKQRGTFNETAQLNPRNPYSAAKCGADRMAQAFFTTYGLPVVISRPSNNYGPRQFPEKLVPLFIHHALHDEPLPVYGDGKQIRDWLHVEDHCEAMGFLIEQGEPGEAYNIPGSSEKRNIETIQFILAELDKPTTLIRYVEDRPGHDVRYPLNGEKIASLGWRRQVTWEDGFRQTIRWYVRNQDWLEMAIRRGRDFHAKWYAHRK